MILGCEEEVPEVLYPATVALLTPEEGSVFTESAPEFVWSSDSLATSYIIKIAVDDFGDGFVLYQDTLTDTIWQMGNDLFTQIYQGSYEWSVAPLPVEEELLWSNPLTFSIDNSSPEPFLISPEDGAVFDVSAPVFNWYKAPEASSYVIRIVKDAFFSGVVIVEDTVTDTTYTMPAEDFVGSLNSDYVWGVGVLGSSEGITWRGLRSFELDKPAIDLDLDTTYFPFGLDYSWTYETYSWYYYWEAPYPPEEEYDTVTITVTDSIFGESGWIFYLNGSFRDVGDTVSILGNKVFLYDSEWISINPKIGDYDAGIAVNYEDDTACISRHTSGHYLWDDFLDAYWSCDRSVLRLKGIGVVFEEYSYNDRWGESGEEAWYNSSSLLYFCKGTDTIWRREP